MSRPDGFEQRVPPVPKTLTMAKIRAGIPKELFVRSTAKSFYYLFRDFLQIYAAFAIMHYAVLPGIERVAGAENSGSVLVQGVKAAFWCAYWFAQATNFTAVWVLGGHEGGHGAFSPYEFVNELVGFFCHSCLLVPYHSWRVTHAHHHKYTNHLTMDTAFVPEKKETPIREAVLDSPLVSFVKFMTSLILGWPMYFVFNVWGRDVPGASNMSHFLPNSGYFQSSDRLKVILSDVCLILVTGVLGLGVQKYGWWPVFAYYYVPYLGCNAWLVLITFLHHTNPRVAHFSADEFTFERGATSAIDRDYGAWLNPWMHHITDSHVMHHLDSSVPFYHAITITREYLKPMLGASYLEDHRSLWAQTAEAWRHCNYVVPREGVAYWYQ